MALRDQPYLPLYVQDFLTDEKLIECSASATGIYIRIMCIMHKSDEYGVILLKQKDKQMDKQINNFAFKLAKHLPYSNDEIILGLTELIDEGVLHCIGDKLFQKRMIQDNNISIVRADAGKIGGLKTQFAKSKIQANTESEYDVINENEIVNNNSKNNEVIFEEFRLKYPGTKGGFEIEYKNFIKKSKNGEIDLLIPALQYEINHKKKLKDLGKFCPEWKNLKTWINQKCWLQQFECDNEEQPETKKEFSNPYWDLLKPEYR